MADIVGEFHVKLVLDWAAGTYRDIMSRAMTSNLVTSCKTIKWECIWEKGPIGNFSRHKI